jgi:hypothetical protein
MLRSLFLVPEITEISLIILATNDVYNKYEDRIYNTTKSFGGSQSVYTILARVSESGKILPSCHG